MQYILTQTFHQCLILRLNKLLLSDIQCWVYSVMSRESESQGVYTMYFDTDISLMLYSAIRCTHAEWYCLTSVFNNFEIKWVTRRLHNAVLHRYLMNVVFCDEMCSCWVILIFNNVERKWAINRICKAFLKHTFNQCNMYCMLIHDDIHTYYNSR